MNPFDEAFGNKKKRRSSSLEENRARYYPLVQAAAKRYNIPEEIFDRLVTQESGYNAGAISPKGAAGIGQFMPGTAKEFGIDPYNPEQALDATGKFLSRNFKEFGRWDLAAAGYNAGPGAVRRYKGVPPYKETQHYVKVVVPREYHGESPQYRTVAAVEETNENPFDAAFRKQQETGTNPFDAAFGNAKPTVTPAAPAGTLKPVGPATTYRPAAPTTDPLEQVATADPAALATLDKWSKLNEQRRAVRDKLPAKDPRRAQINKNIRALDEKYIELHQQTHGFPPIWAPAAPAAPAPTGAGYSLNPSDAFLQQSRERVEKEAEQIRQQVAERQRLRGPNSPDTRLDRLGQARSGRTFGEWGLDLVADIGSLGTSGEWRSAQDLVVNRAIEAARKGELPSPQFSDDKDEKIKQQALLGRKIGPRAKAYLSNVMREYQIKLQQADREFAVTDPGQYLRPPLKEMNPASHLRMKYDMARREALAKWERFPEELEAQLAKQGVKLDDFGKEVARVIAFEQGARLLDRGKVGDAANAAAATNLLSILVPGIKGLKGADKFVSVFEKLAAREGLNTAAKVGSKFLAQALRPSEVAADAIFGEVGALARAGALETPYNPGVGAATAAGTGGLVRGTLGTVFGNKPKPGAAPEPVAPSLRKPIRAVRGGVAVAPGRPVKPLKVNGAIVDPPLRRPGGALQQRGDAVTATEPIVAPRKPLPAPLVDPVLPLKGTPRRGPTEAPTPDENPNLPVPKKLGISEPVATTNPAGIPKSSPSTNLPEIPDSSPPLKPAIAPRISKEGEIEIPGVKRYTPEESADLLRVYAEGADAKAELGSKRFERATVALGELEEAGHLDAAVKAREDWLHGMQQAEVKRGTQSGARMDREAGLDLKTRLAEAHSQGLSVQHQAGGKTYRLRNIENVSKAEREEFYKAIATPGRLHTRSGAERIYHAPNGSGSLRDLVVDMGYLPEDVIAPSRAPGLKEAVKAGTAEVVTRPSGYGKSNKVFTEERANAARERVLKKFGRTNAGIDPELIRDGIEIAGYHIEAGARTFADYSRAMLEDFGDGVKPHLRQWYEAVRHHPDFDTKGMSRAEEIAALERGDAPTPKAEKTPIQPQSPRSTGLANQVLRREIEAGTLKSMPKSVGWVNERVALQQGADAIDSGRINPQALADSIDRNPRAATPEEYGALTLGAAQLKKEILAAREAFDADPTNPTLKADYHAAQDAFQKYMEKVQKAKTASSASLNAIKAGVDIDTGQFEDVIQDVRRARGAASVKDIPEKVQQEFTALTEAKAKADADLAAREKELTEAQEALATSQRQIAELEINTRANSPETGTTRTPTNPAKARQAKQERLKSELKQHFSSLDALVKEALEGGGGRGLFADTGAGAAGEAARVAYHVIKKGGANIAGKIALNLAEQGKLGFDGVIDQVVKTFRAKGIDITAEDITAEITDLASAGKRPGAGKALQSAASKLKRDAAEFERLTALKRRIDAGEIIPTPQRKAQVEGRLADLRKGIRTALQESGQRQRPIPPPRTPKPEAQRLAELRKKITDLKAGKYPPSKSKATVSVEIAAAQKEYRELAAQNPNRVKAARPKLSPEVKAARAEAREIQRTQQNIEALKKGPLPKKAVQPKPVSPAMAKLKAEETLLKRKHALEAQLKQKQEQLAGKPAAPGKPVPAKPGNAETLALQKQIEAVDTQLAAQRRAAEVVKQKAAVKARIAKLEKGEYPVGKPKAAVDAELAALRKQERQLLAKNPARAKRGGGSGRGRGAMTDHQLIDAANTRAAKYQRQLETGQFDPVKTVQQRSEAVRAAQARAAHLHRVVLGRIKAQQPRTLLQKAGSVQKQALLSNPVTHLKNILSTGGFVAQRRLVEQPLQALFELPWAAAGKDRSVTVTDVVKGWGALGRGVRAGLRGAGQSLKTGLSPEAARAGELPHAEVGTVKGVPTLALGSRLMGAEDAFFKGVLYETELASLASNKAGKEGLKGAAHKNRLIELLNDAELQAEASKRAKEYTFNEDPDKLTQWLNHGKATVPGLDLVIPFTSTPWNVAKAGVRYSPLGLLRLFDKNARKGNVSKIAAQGAVGTMTLASIYALMQDREFYGAPPGDINERRKFFADGKRPNSIKLGGGRWLDFSGLGPLTTQLGVIADLKQNFWQKGKTTPPEQFARLALSLARATNDGSFLNSMDALAEVFENDRNLNRFGARAVRGIVPFSGAVAGVANATDPSKPVKNLGDAMTTPPRYRKARDFGEELKLGVPVLRKQVPRGDRPK